MKKSDQRVVVTKRMLKEGLMSLLREKEIDKINVSELCSVSGINRATFYNHYYTPRDVLAEIGSEMLSDIKKITRDSEDIEGERKQLEITCAYLYENADAVRLLMKCNTDEEIAALFDEASRKLWEEKRRISIFQDCDEDSFRLLSTFFWSGTYSIVQKWLTEGIKKSPKEIVGLIFTMLGAVR